MLRCDCHSAGSALQNLSADEEVPEKEYEGIPRLKSTLNIKSKPKTKHQKGTYRRGRTLGKSSSTPTSNDSRIITAASARTLSGSASFDLDLSEPQSVDSLDLAPSLTVAEGSVLAPSREQEERYVAKSAEVFRGRRNPADGDEGGNGVSEDRLDESQGFAQRAAQADERQGEGSMLRGSGSGGRQDDWEGSGARGSRQSASNTLATRDAGDQAAARVQEPLSEEPQGYSLMWCALQNAHFTLDKSWRRLDDARTSTRRVSLMCLS